MNRNKDTEYAGIAAIDPSLRNAGLSIFTIDTILPPQVEHAWQVTFPGGPAVEYKNRAWQMCSHLVRAIERSCHVPYAVVVETPTNWFTERGNASKDNEAVQRLYFFVGMLTGMLGNAAGCCSVWGVEPGQWKGSTPKPIMISRACKFLDCTNMPDDAAESVLLGRFALTKLQGNRFAEPFRLIVPGPAGTQPITPCTFEDFCR